MLKQIKLMIIMVFNIHCEVNLNIDEVSEISLSRLPPTIKTSDFIDPPIKFSNIIPKKTKILYFFTNISFYIVNIFNTEWKNFDMQNNNIHIFFLVGMVCHGAISLLPFFIPYFKFRTIFAIFNNGIIVLLLFTGEQLPLHYPLVFYIFNILTHGILNIILFSNNRKYIIFNLTPLVEELQQSSNEKNNIENFI